MEGSGESEGVASEIETSGTDPASINRCAHRAAGLVLVLMDVPGLAQQAAATQEPFAPGARATAAERLAHDGPTSECG